MENIQEHERHRDRKSIANERMARLSNLLSKCVLLIAGSESSPDSTFPATITFEVATTREVEGADLTPAVTAGDLTTHGVDMSFSPMFVTEGLMASSAGPSLLLLVEVRERLAADFRAG